MSKCLRAWGLVAFAVAMEVAPRAVSVAQDSVPTGDVPVIALLPLANYSGNMSAVERVLPLIERQLNGMPLDVKERDETRQVLRRHRIRAIGMIDRSGAHALARDLGVDYLMTGSVNVFAPGGIPEVGLSLRLVDARSLRVVWARSAGATGDDFVTVFGLGRISSIDAIAEYVVTTALESLEEAFTKGPAAGPDVHQVVYNTLLIASDSALADSETVTITVVDEDNAAPVLSEISSPRTTETKALEFVVSARDPDGTIPALITTELPIGAVFDDHGDGTATLSWTPGFTDAGTYAVTFITTDGVLADSQLVTITIYDIGNQTPVVIAVPPQHTREDTTLTFTVSATDADGTIPALGIVNLPEDASFVDRGDGTGVFEWTPGFAAAGIHKLVVTASDEASIDSATVAVTVDDAGKQAPALTVVGPEGTTEGAVLNMGVTASDPDATIPHLWAIDLPDGATLTDHGDGTATLFWTPGFTDAGIYPVTLIASDGMLADSETVSIVVGEAGNQTPVLTAAAAQSTTENIALSVVVTASDRDATTPRLAAMGLPQDATLIDHGDGTGSLVWTPGFTDAGVYNVAVIASDGVLADSGTVSITVLDAGNQIPTLTAIGPQTTTEGTTLNVNLSAADPDGTVPHLLAAKLPAGADLSDHGDGTGTLTWTPGFTDAGIYNVVVIASDGMMADSESVSITVLDAGNQPPMLTVDSWQGTTENVALTFTVSAVDPDGTIPALSATALPQGATLTDHGDGTASFDWTPDSTQLGIHPVTLSASDGEAADTATVAINVLASGSAAPVLSEISSPRTTETKALGFVVSARDPDGTIPALITSGLPVGAVFDDHGDGTATLSWTPGFTDAGTYPVMFIAADGVLADSQLVTITVDDIGNQTPVVIAVPPQHTREDTALTFTVSATDADGTIPTLGIVNLPEGALFIDRGDGTGVFEWTPGFAAAGIHKLVVTASDEESVDSLTVAVTVDDAGKQAPALTVVGPEGTTEGAVLNMRLIAGDPDATIPHLWSIDLPDGATLTDHGDGTATLSWTPGFTDAGIYPVTLIASDGMLADSETVSIVVGEAGNQIPALANIRLLSTMEGIPLNVPVSAGDPDMTTPRLWADGLPSAASFTDNGDGTGTLDWTPDYTDAGLHHVLVVASDGVLADSEWVPITVHEAGNQVPMLTTVEPKSTTEGTALNVNFSAVDPDGTVPHLLAAELPAGADLSDHGDGTGTLTWTPGFTDAGIYNVVMIASDGTLADSELVSITVLDAGNQPPMLTVDSRQGTTENVALTFTVSAGDPDGTIPALSATALPPGATLTDHGDGTAAFDWTPGFTDDLGRELIALVPFDDLQPELHGGSIVATQILTELVTRGYAVLDPGAVQELFLRFGRTPRGGIDYELLAALRDSLYCTAALTGVVDDFLVSSSSAERSFPSMTVSGWLTDAKTGRIRAFADISRTGDREHFFGFGRTRSAVTLARDASAALLDKLGLDKESSVAVH